MKIANIASDFADHEQCLGMTYQDYQEKMHNFKMELKCLTLSFFLTPTTVKQKLIDLKERKIAGFFYNSLDLYDSSETIKLMITQGIIVSDILLKDLDLHFFEEVKDLKKNSLEQQKFFSKLQSFYLNLKHP